MTTVQMYALREIFNKTSITNEELSKKINKSLQVTINSCHHLRNRGFIRKKIIKINDPNAKRKNPNRILWELVPHQKERAERYLKNNFPEINYSENEYGNENRFC